MTDHAEPWDDQGHHSNIYDANGDCIATVFNHRAHIIACVNRCYGINPDAVPLLLKALLPFKQSEFSKELGGNQLGDDSVVFARNGQELRIGDFRIAAVALAKAYEEE